MKKDDLEDYQLPYVDFYLEIPHTDTTDYLNDIQHGIHDDHNPAQDGVGLSDEQVSEIRRDSLDAAASEPTQPAQDDEGLFSADQNQ